MTTINVKVHIVLKELIERISEHRMAMTHANVVLTKFDIVCPLDSDDEYWNNYMSIVYPWNQLKGVMNPPEELYGKDITLDVEVVSELFKKVVN